MSRHKNLKGMIAESYYDENGSDEDYDEYDY
jgi:hypothetical protein